MAEDTLKRRIGLGLLTAYGVGVMIGAGIYVLVGAVAAEAGVWAPLAFLLAGFIAAPTALSYAELSARLPQAAGEAVFVAEGFRADWVGLVVGLAIVAAGSVSAAAVLRGGVGYLTGVVDVPSLWAIIAIGGALTLVAVIGVLESLALAALFTLIEVVGLALVVYAGLTAPLSPDVQGLAFDPASLPVMGLIGGGVLAFFAFIGFEDIVNMAEEVREPEKTVPRAILLALVITTLVYAGVTVAAVRAVPVEALAASERPLVLVWQAGQGGGAQFLSLIAVVAALNGILAQIVMAARVLFGLGRRHGVLSVFHHTSDRFNTPALATITLGAVVIALALTLDISRLAEVTSTILLTIFILVNAALLLIKRRAPKAPFQVPALVPALGLILSFLAVALNLGSLL